jgi:hypothetical protein
MMLHEMPPQYLIPEELAGTHARLVNWARWSRDRPAVVRCYSLEGRYRPELLRGDEEQERRHATMPVDVRDALRVYRAVNVTHGFPARMAFALAAEYVFRLPPEMFSGYMRRHGFPVRHRALAELVNEARYMARNAILRADHKTLADASPVA